MERWMDCHGLEGRYEICENGDIRHKETKDSKYSRINTSGYREVKISVDGKRKHFRVHRLVAQTFLENPENKPQVNHIDGNKLNNRLDNLEWCTASENVKHAFRIGLKVPLSGKNHHWCGRENKRYLGKSGRLHPRSKPIAQYDLNMNLIKIHESQNLAAKELGINQGRISRAIKLNGSAAGFYWKKI